MKGGDCSDTRQVSRNMQSVHMRERVFVVPPLSMFLGKVETEWEQSNGYNYCCDLEQDTPGSNLSSLPQGPPGWIPSHGVAVSYDAR